MKDDGGPAFPQPTEPLPLVNGKGERTGEWVWDFDGAAKGMSLRDWFAGQERTQPPHWVQCDTPEEAAKQIAAWRYLCADAMLAERQRDMETGE